MLSYYVAAKDSQTKVCVEFCGSKDQPDKTIKFCGNKGQVDNGSGQLVLRVSQAGYTSNQRGAAFVELPFAGD